MTTVMTRNNPDGVADAKCERAVNSIATNDKRLMKRAASNTKALTVKHKKYAHKGVLAF